MKPITAEYIRKFGILILIALFAWMYYHPPLKNYSYIMLILALLAYLFGPKTKIPEGAAYYSKILVMDIFSYLYWLVGMMILFFDLDVDDNLIGQVVFIFLVFGTLPLYLMWYSVKLSSRWYRFTKDTFQLSDAEGVQSVALNDIESAEPYAKRKYPFSPSEMGMQIITKSGKKIRMMSNNLETDEIFMKHLQEFYLAYDDTFSQYFKDGTFPEGDEKFNENLQELQGRMRKQ